MRLLFCLVSSFLLLSPTVLAQTSIEELCSAESIRASWKQSPVPFAEGEIYQAILFKRQSGPLFYSAAFVTLQGDTARLVTVDPDGLPLSHEINFVLKQGTSSRTFVLDRGDSANPAELFITEKISEGTRYLYIHNFYGAGKALGLAPELGPTFQMINDEFAPGIAMLARCSIYKELKSQIEIQRIRVTLMGLIVDVPDAMISPFAVELVEGAIDRFLYAFDYYLKLQDDELHSERAYLRLLEKQQSRLIDDILTIARYL